MQRWKRSFHLDEKINRFLEVVNSVLSATHFSIWIAEFVASWPNTSWEFMGMMQNRGNAGEGGVSCRLPVQTGPTGMLLKHLVSGRSSPLKHLCSAVPLKNALQSVSTISLLLKLQIKPRPEISFVVAAFKRNDL